MLKEMKYGALFGKVRAMSGKLLSNEDYLALIKKNSEAQVVSYLKDYTHYATLLKDIDENSFRRDHLENILRKDIIKDYSKLIKFTRGSIKDFIKLYYIKNEIESLKLIFRSYEAGRVSYEDIEDVLVFMANHDEVNIPMLALSRNLQEFLNRLKGTQYYKLLKPFADEDTENRIFNMEMVLDLYYLADLRRNYGYLLGRDDKKNVAELLGMEADIFNIFWIYRSKRYYNMELEIIRSFSAHLCYKLNTKTIEALINAKSLSEYIDLVKKTPYKFLVNEGEDNLLEHNYWIFIYREHSRRAKFQPFSIECVISYLRMKEIEVNNIISIINAVHYNLPTEALNRYVVGVKL